MKVIKIKQEKQDNGLWGTPLNCYAIDRVSIQDDRKIMIFSAVIVAVNEKYQRKFKILSSNNHEFRIQISGNDISVGDYYKISYDKYEVIDNTLFQFDNDQEHITFLRQHKLKKLQNVDLGV
jgi:hypothetical protein